MHYIMQIFPPKIRTYVELFGGSGSILLGMPPKAGRLDIYNDLDADLSNLFLCVRDHCGQLLAELKFLPIHSRAVFEIYKYFLAHREVHQALYEQAIRSELELLDHREYFTEEQAEELRPILLERAQMFDVERAAVFYKSVRGSFSGTVTSFGLRSLPISRYLYLIEKASKRLQEAAIENKSATQLMTELDDEDTLFYGDPPYFQAERSYRVRFQRKLHIRLWQKACSRRGYVVLSYNDCPFIRQLYRDFYLLADEAAAYQENDIMMGLKYLLLLAASRGLPLVAVLGLGTSQGSHEGTSPLGKMLNQAAEFSGVIPVLAAGNEAARSRHFLGSVDRDAEYEDVEIRVADGEKGFVLELWARDPELYTVGFLSPTGERIARIPLAFEGDNRVRFLLEQTEITVNYIDAEAGSGSQLIFMRFQAPTAGPPPKSIQTRL